MVAGLPRSAAFSSGERGKYVWRNIQGPACKLCRREGEKLFLKGERCFTPKCAFERRGFAPGQHGRTGGRGGRGGQGRESDYAKQLRAKQKARRIYGIYEAQFRRYYGKALKARGITGLMLLADSLNPVWIMSSSGWVLHPAVPRPVCWSRMVTSRSMAVGRTSLR